MAITQPNIIQTLPEYRQIARVLEFSPVTAPHINWNSIAETARQLGAHFEARTDNQGACTVTMFWRYEADELKDELKLGSRYTLTLEGWKANDAADEAQKEW